MPPDRPEHASSPGAPPAERNAPASLEALRGAVRRAARTIGQLREETRRLRAENEALRKRVARLEENPGAEHDGATLLLDDEPAALRERIDRFIDAIDAHLEER